MRGRVCAAVAALALGTAPIAALAQDELLTVVPVDVVEASHGRDVAGSPELWADHGRYRYQFSDDESLERFLKRPEAYEVMWDGACGRMGPLSGRGSPERYAIHEGRVFLFASEQCRQTFLAAPERCIEREERPPAPGEGDHARGRELIDLAVVGMGGGNAVDGVRVLREVRVKPDSKDAPAGPDRVVTTYILPDAVHRSEVWGDWYFSTWARRTSGATRIKDGKPDPMGPDACRAMDQAMSRHPLVILRARNNAEFVASRDGQGQVGVTAVEYVTVFCGQARTRLGIDPQSGRVLSATHQGRGARSLVGEVARTYADFRDVGGGLILAHESTATFDGEPFGPLDVRLQTIEINPALEPGLLGEGEG